MRTPQRTTLAWTATLISVMSLTGGLASAAPIVGDLPWPAPATGGDTPLPDRYLERTTADGWVLHALKEQETLHINPPLDGAATTGEAFGTLSARVWIDGQGEPELTGGFFEAGYQVGCGVDISQGVDYDIAATLGVAPHGDVGVEGGPHGEVGVEGGPSVNLGGQAGPEVTVTLPQGNATLGADAKAKGEAGADATAKAEAGADATAKAAGGVEGKAEISPRVSGHLDPGKVSNVALVSRGIDGHFKRSAGGFDGAHIQINGCAGPVSVRSYVRISTTSPTSVDVVNVYGDPRRIR
ncbi:MspA family porin [Corynebacterium uberis]|uniref:MspA family porin n=1 Tax=Corynebacterium uberis TaxID=2883169 RepID=UPI001D0ADE85|nr:MspA family porin [Corynebacterium uberis]UDL75792.1 MspA family porin [Corynebacterium uberis]UDL80287.1 MspA family porin [Corynebacterium uberis]UDL84629.1 MspA family porin [Corynebacterium uberis]